MNILQVSTSDFGGGAERIAWDLYKGYQNQGQKSWLAVGYKRTDENQVFEIPTCVNPDLWDDVCSSLTGVIKPFKGRIYGAGYLSQLIEMSRYPSHFIERAYGHEDYEYQGTWELLQLPTHNPDILHCHNLHGDYFDLRSLPKLSHQVPIVLTLHDAWLLSGHCAHSFDCERWKTGCGNCPDLSIYPAIRRDATAYNWQRKAEIYRKSRLYVVTPCEWLMDRVNQSMLKPGIVASKVIPNGVDLNIFHPANQVEAREELNLPLDINIILFAANGIKKNIWKDYVTLRKALEEVAKCKKKVLCIALGEEAPSEHIANIEIKFVPYLSNTKLISRYYQASDIYVHPAKAETFPTSILESLACGIPVIASDVGGIPEQVIEGKNGFLTPVGNHYKLAENIIYLLENENLRVKLGNSGFTEAKEKYSLNKMVLDYLNFYDSIL